MGCSQLLAGITLPLFTPEPFPVEKARACNVESQRSWQKAIDRLAVQILRCLTIAEYGAAPRLNRKRPFRAARVRTLHQTFERRCRGCMLPGTAGRFD